MGDSSKPVSNLPFDILQADIHDATVEALASK